MTESSTHKTEQRKYAPPLEQTASLGRCLVTGGAGFLGRNLVKSLLNSGCRVVALINKTPLNLFHPELTIIKGDIRNPDDVRKACKNIDTVFHAAASIKLMGGSFASSKYKKDTWDINVEGTQNVIDACKGEGVKRLIYTSSVDVCFEGRPAPNMHEAYPYAKQPKSVYAATKIEAEKRVLEANAKSGLLTCVIRPDGIYGAEPNELIDRFHDQLIAGRLKARIGNPNTLQDNSNVANLVHGEILAAKHLTDGGIACGKAYFICDHEPMNSFDFFRPLVEGLGYPFPALSIPAWFLRPITALWQALHFLLNLPEPMLSPHELDKITVTHYASIEKARLELGYRPVVQVSQAIKECLEYCKKKKGAV